MTRVLVATVVTLSVWTLAAAQDEAERHTLPDDVKKALEAAENWELYSLDPKGFDVGAEIPKSAFMRFAPLGKTTIKDPETRKKLLSALLKGIDEAKNDWGAKCFRPRHGIRIISQGKPLDIGICFECSWVYVNSEGKKFPSIVISDSQAEVFNKVLKDADIPLAPAPPAGKTDK